MTEFWQDRRTFVTGASGLLGGWLVRRLLDAEADVVCLLRDWVPGSDLVANLLDEVHVVRGDVTDREVVERTLGEYEAETVFHLAAQTIVPIANRNPISTFESNVRGTWNLLEATRRSPTVEQIVTASSDKAYGEQEDLPYTEDAPLNARHPYDVSKAAADMITQSYAETYDIPAVVTRCGNFYGGGDLNWNRLVPGTIRSVIRGHRPEIRSDGTYVRDYIYVEDGAHAYTHAAEELAKRPELSGQAFNFSTEEPLSVLEMVERVMGLMGTELKPRILNEATGEIQDQILDASKARTELGWEPRYGLEEGLTRTIAWYRSHLGAGA